MMKTAFFRDPFLQEGRPHLGLILLFVAISLLVAANALLHHPEIGYDANDHLLYMQVLPQRLPTDADTREFFSPPLPYFLPALADEACLALSKTATAGDCRYLGGKAGQIINVALAVGTLFLVLKLAELWRPQNVRFKLLALFFLGALPVFYKTFSEFWGQPYVAFFSTLALWQLANLLKQPETFSAKRAAALGLTLGLLALSRQWGFFVILSVLALVVLLVIGTRARGRRLALAKSTALALAVAFLVSGWFYIYLYATEGSFTAFNRNTRGFALSNKAPSFYRNTGLKDWRLFREPVYGTFNDMLFPIFYSDIWGDYWGFYSLPNLTEQVLSIWDWNDGDYRQARADLGRANLLSIPLALALVAGLGLGARRSLRLLRSDRLALDCLIPGFITILTIVSAAGYLWFVISYPSESGDTIKASYLIHLFVLLPLLVADGFEAFSHRSRPVFSFALAVCALAVVHNLPLMLTRYIYWP